MSCLNLRLPPAKKAWKAFTSKLQSKLSLHKLQDSKSMKKKSKYKTKTKAIIKRRIFSSSSYSLLPFKRRRRSVFFPSPKKPAPVYIDKLFREPVADELVAQRLQSAKTVKVLVDKQASREDGRGNGRGVGEADDMWESLGFASPQMRGIDERAEQFIASFRAEMEVQEKIARGIYIENGSSS
ncbi:hypothetical protein JCGZ_17693 [Jatropha curcas]|uniref:Uncharacterized protein n=1 Tax=Jatropha curcas TaxID=180498 RepID=A0A067K2P8_JATCU|nr:hypothetical protein JCGZ_17693 [Jatropha curcas]